MSSRLICDNITASAETSTLISLVLNIMNPVTTTSLVFAVLPLIVAALEKYQNTFQPMLIFARRYRREAEKFQDALKVQKSDLENECYPLFRSVAAYGGGKMISNPRDRQWKDEGLETHVKARLDHCYDASISALRLINSVLTEILEETKSLHILLQEV